MSRGRERCWTEYRHGCEAASCRRSPHCDDIKYNGTTSSAILLLRNSSTNLTEAVLTGKKRGDYKFCVYLIIYFPSLIQIVPQIDRYYRLEDRPLNPTLRLKRTVSHLFSMRRPVVQRPTTTITAHFLFVLCLFGLRIRGFCMKWTRLRHSAHLAKAAECVSL